MVYIDTEGKFNDNSYLVDGLLFRLPHHLSIYIIENNGMRMMIDLGVPIAARKVVKKIKEFDLFPIHKILITHSHWDHIQAFSKLEKLLGETEILASAKAIEDLKNTERMTSPYRTEEFQPVVNPIENVTPLKEGDIIDLNGLELEIFNFFGHTMDSIAIYDKRNKNIFVGDAIIDCWDRNTINGVIMPPDFNESELIKTFNKLRDMRENLESISLAHFGVWKDNDLDFIINNMEEYHYKTKDSIIQWYSENNSIEYVAKKFHEKYIPNSTIHTKENIHGFEFLMNFMITGLKMSGFIK
jgi:glyoxylase-like metal-dependent hydrolase (beta-lactamase superfamily II)